MHNAKCDILSLRGIMQKMGCSTEHLFLNPESGIVIREPDSRFCVKMSILDDYASLCNLDRLAVSLLAFAESPLCCARNTISGRRDTPLFCSQPALALTSLPVHESSFGNHESPYSIRFGDSGYGIGFRGSVFGHILAFCSCLEARSKLATRQFFHTYGYTTLYYVIKKSTPSGGV